MNSLVKMSEGIGKKLILSVSIILLFTVLSVYVSTLVISKINETQDNISKNSIPSLIDVGHLSRISVNIIKQSNLMSSATSLETLNRQMDEASMSIVSLKDYLVVIEDYGLPYELISDIEILLNHLDENVTELYSLVSRKLDYDKRLSYDINTRNASIEIIEEKATLIKVNTHHEFIEKINNIENHQKTALRDVIYEEVNDIELFSNIITSSGELRKDINAVYQSVNDESVLLIQQEFNHSLRKIIRTIVQNKNAKLKDDIKDSIVELIELGQDSPDIFDNRRSVITISKRLEMISQENLIHTQRLNTAVFSLSNEVRFNAESASGDLHNVIIKSKSILYVIALIALIVSLIISWKYIYLGIVVRLSNLSSITKKLLINDFDFQVDTQGNDELSDIALALESLKEHSLKRVTMNEALHNNAVKLKQSNEDLSQFAYIASHDLREPLRMVSSYVQLLESKYKGKLDSDADKYIKFAVQGCVRMKALIDGLLEYSHVENNNESFQEIDCNKLVNEVIQDLSVPINESNAKIILENLPMINAVPTQLRIVFSNLIGNALKYCDEKSPRIEICSQLLEENIQFSIKDNGIGIKPQYQEKIFVIFKRLHSRAEYDGTGIGLSVCKKIIERHSGDIALESTFGVGSTFFITLPVEQSMVAADNHQIAV